MNSIHEDEASRAERRFLRRVMLGLALVLLLAIGLRLWGDFNQRSTLEMLRSARVEDRLVALRLFREYPSFDKEVEGALLDALVDSDSRVRKLATSVFMSRGGVSDFGLERAGRWLRAGTLKERQLALSLLALAEGRARAYAPDIKKVGESDRDGVLRVRAWVTLWEVTKESTESLGPLLKELGNKDPKVAARAFESLLLMGEAAQGHLKALQAYLERLPDGAEREERARALARYRRLIEARGGR